MDYVTKNISKLFDYIKNILDPNFDRDVEKNFKRFNDDIYTRDNKLYEI